MFGKTEIVCEKISDREIDEKNFLLKSVENIEISEKISNQKVAVEKLSRKMSGKLKNLWKNFKSKNWKPIRNNIGGKKHSYDGDLNSYHMTRKRNMFRVPLCVSINNF